MDDLINRQAAIDMIEQTIKANSSIHYEMRYWEDGMNCAKIILEDLPSAQKTGAWIKMSDSDGIYYACSQCGEDIPRIAHFEPQYCPNCGARMDGDADADKPVPD